MEQEVCKQVLGLKDVSSQTLKMKSDSITIKTKMEKVLEIKKELRTTELQKSKVTSREKHRCCQTESD